MLYTNTLPRLTDELSTSPLAIGEPDQRQEIPGLIAEAIEKATADWFVKRRERTEHPEDPPFYQVSSRRCSTAVTSLSSQPLVDLEKLCLATLEMCSIALARIKPIFTK